MAQDWQRIEPTIIKQFSQRSIVAKNFKLPDGQVIEWGTLYPEGEIDVVTIALTPDKKVLIFSQFRAGPEMIMEDLPGGKTGQDTDPKAEAMRELEEETGYVPGTMEFLGKLCQDAYANYWLYVYFATDCRPGRTGQKLDLEEMSGEVKLIAIDQLIENAKSGRMSTTGAILLAYDKLQKLKGASKS